VLLGLAESGVALPISQELLYWHVQISIAMFWIAIFHIHSYWMSSPGKKSGESQDPHKKSPGKFKSSLKSGISPGKSTDNSNEKEGMGLK